MYLISVYFDKKTVHRIQSYINDVADKSGNTFMIDNNVPPHMTISAFESLKEDEIVDALNSVLSDIPRNKIGWVTVGTFHAVIFVQPVLNEYLHNITSVIYDSIVNVPDTKISKCYKPFNWLPHTTIAKQLSEDEMRIAFDVLQKKFCVFEGDMVRVELAKKNPYCVIASWELK